jgi:tetratricopeptide (TPR) repeat protein
VRADRVVAVQAAARGSGYVIADRLVLTGAHATPPVGGRVSVRVLAAAGAARGVVVWRGTPGGRDDAALVQIDDPAWRPPPGSAPPWGRVVTNRPGIDAHAWGFPHWLQRPGQQLESWQPSGTLNPGNRFAGDQYVLSISAGPPAPPDEGGSPWAGLSGAALFCDRLLAGVVVADPAGGRHAHLAAVPAYALHHDERFRAVLARHGAAGPLAAVECQHLAEAPPRPPRSPASLLRAGEQVVAFRSRAELLGRLRAWAQAGAGFGVWLIHGPAGQGKTRLGYELARLLADERWACVWLRHDAVDGLDVLAEAAVPLLLVVDYAETRGGGATGDLDQLSAVLRACARHDGSTPLRVLLLARTAGDWWQRLRVGDRVAEELLAGAPTTALPVLEPEPAGQQAAYRQAVADLTGRLPGLPGLADRDWSGLAATLPPPRPGGAAPTVLALHMTALADLLDAADRRHLPDGPAPPGQGGEWVEDRLLGHERRYWTGAARRGGLLPVLSEAALLDALTAAFLLGAADRAQADALLARVPALADQPRDRRDSVRRWIAGLYPAAEPGHPWGVLQPDRLAERFVGTRLAGEPDLVDHLVPGATGQQAARLLTGYARAAHHPGMRGGLDAALTRLCIRHRGLVVPAVAAIPHLEAPGPLIEALRTLTMAPDTPLGLLVAVSKELPSASLHLADLAAELAQRLTDRYRERAGTDPEAFLPDLARALNNLAVDLGALGRREDGLAAIEEAVTIRRGLVATRPQAFLPELAMSLDNLAIRLGELGRRDEALAPAQEAVTTYRQLAATRPDAYLPGLARAANNLAVRLGELGRRDEALAAAEEAVTAHRRLAATRPDAYLPELAMSLDNRAIRLGELGRRDEGLAAAEEAVTTYRRLAATRPDAYLPGLARALNNLSVDLGELGRLADSVAAIGEAVTIRRRLAATRPEAFLPGLAMSWGNLAVRLGELGRHEEAAAVAREAVTTHRRLAATRPDAFLPGLAGALNNLAMQVGALGRRGEALAAIEEAVATYRRLAATCPERFLPDLAMALTNLAVNLGELGRRAEGRAAVAEAVRIRRRLAARWPDAFRRDLDRSLAVRTALTDPGDPPG